LEQKPIFKAEGVELVCSNGAFRGVPTPEYSWSDIAHLENVQSILFTRILFQAPYVGTKNNGSSELSSFVLVLKFVCQARAWIRKIRDEPYRYPDRGSLFEAWGLDHNPELVSCFRYLGIDPLSSETSPSLFNKYGLMYSYDN